MIYLIYATIIIEILFAIFAIYSIIQFNNKINTLNDTILENRYKIKLKAEEIQKDVYDFCDTIKICGKKVVEKKKAFAFGILKNIILSIGLMILSKKYKKQVLYIELALIAYDTYKNSIKV